MFVFPLPGGSIEFGDNADPVQKCSGARATKREQPQRRRSDVLEGRVPHRQCEQCEDRRGGETADDRDRNRVDLSAGGGGP